MPFKTKEALAQELAKDEADIRLAYAALLFAAHLTQGFDVAGYLARLDELAGAVEAAVRSATTDEARISALNEYLFGQLGFRGNAPDYYNPNNSFLNRVLDFRTGIPISLSVVYMETGWRLGLPLWGVGLPGHFIVGYGPAAGPIYVDVFNEGRIMSEADCLALARVPPSQHPAFKQEFLKPVLKKAILYRMLLNLKLIYVGVENWAAAYHTVDLMLVVRPDLVVELRDRGLLAYRLNRLQSAIFDLKDYLLRVPDGPDADQLKRQIETMEAEYLRLN